MIVMQGVCSLCSDGKVKRLAKKKPALCGYHYYSEQNKKYAERNKNKPTKINKPLKRSALTYKREPTGELTIFHQIWDSTEEHVSFINGESIPFFDVFCFAHVLAKGKNKFPKFKLYKKNIPLLTREQHHSWDNGLREDLMKLPEWNKMFELEAELKEEYKLLK